MSLRQVKDCPSDERRERTVREIMRPVECLTVSSTASAADALRKMSETDSGRLLVTERGKVVGLITRTGISRFVQIRTDLDAEEQSAA